MKQAILPCKSLYFLQIFGILLLKQAYPFGNLSNTLNYIDDTEELVLLDEDSILFIILGDHRRHSVSESFPINIPQKG